MSTEIKNILIRADSSSSIGSGHIMRDLVLIKEFEKDNIVFATRDLPGNINYKIDEAGFKRITLKTNDFEEVNILIKELKIDMIVIDHYGIDFEFEKKLKDSNPNLMIFVLDDTYEKHHCDILINHNISGNETKYKDIVPLNCELRCGSKYTLLREEFIKVKKEKYKYSKNNNKNIKTIFIAMGGADHSNINIKILEVLKYFRNIKVNIVTTQANKNLKVLINYCKNKPWINLHINSTQIAKLMKLSDFTIVTPSVTVNEIYYLGLPIIGIKTAENQIDMFDFLKKNRYPIIGKFNKDKLKIKIRQSLNKRFYGRN